MRLLIDGHLDLAWNALSWGRDQTWTLDEINRHEAGMTDHASRGRATTCLPEMRRGRIALCQATLLVRAKPEVRPRQGFNRLSLDHPTQSIAHAAAHGQLAYYRLLQRQGHIRIIQTVRDLEDHWKRWEDPEAPPAPIGIILAMEGADPITEPAEAVAWWDAGLRSVNLAHYGKSAYAVGTGEDGPLTPAGIELLAQFERLGMILDATHLSDTSFFEALDRFGGPVLASHNNCRALVPGDRQFSDDQIIRLIERQAVIGVVLDAWMLWPNWIKGQTQREVVPLKAVADHIDHICQLAGNVRHVAIGSDLDGGYGTEQVPLGLDSIADLQRLNDILSERGYVESDIDAIFHGNWLRFFREFLPR
jgi:membrane dipeptidase